jgi:hypothetical protein
MTEGPSHAPRLSRRGELAASGADNTYSPDAAPPVSFR